MNYRTVWAILLGVLATGCREQPRPPAQAALSKPDGRPPQVSVADSSVLPADSVGVLLAVDASADSSVLPADSVGVLLAVDASEDGTPSVSAIALVRDSQLLDPPIGLEGEAAADSFRARWYAARLRYRYFANGVELGFLVAPHAGEAGCSQLDANAQWLPLHGAALPPRGIASNLTYLKTGSPVLRPAVGADASELRRLALQVLADSGLTLSPKENLVARSLWSLTIPRTGGVASFGSFSVPRMDTISTGSGQQYVDTEYAVVVVLERDSAGIRASVLRFNNGRGESLAQWTVYDALDLLGDSTPEVVLRGIYYDSMDYLVYQRTPEGWRMAYSGGGIGC